MVLQNEDAAQARALDWGLWGATAPAAPSSSELQADVDADIVVIGAGYTGLSAALHLAQAGRRVTVLEATEIGHGGSGRNVGLVNAGLWIEPRQVIATLGEPHGPRLLKFLGDAPAAVFDLIARRHIACDAVRHGTLHCAVGPRGFAAISRRATQWRTLGVAVDLLDAARTSHLTGSMAFTGSLRDDRAGTLQPLSYARGLAAAAIDDGVRLYTRSPATHVQRRHERWHVATPAGSVSADWLLVAGDVYSSGPWAGLRRDQVHLPYFNVATAPLAADLRASILPQRQGAWDTEQVLTSFRLDAAGRLVFGSVGALAGSGAAIHYAWARRAVRRMFPQIGAVDFEHAWFGTIGMTDDALPRLHVLGPQALACGGYNGRGIAPGTVFGRLLAAFICGTIAADELPLPITPQRPARFKLAKEILYRVGSQVAHAFDARA
jgi:glycine/D-amino acid oxidase-like deaminating enzyme